MTDSQGNAYDEIEWQFDAPDLEEVVAWLTCPEHGRSIVPAGDVEIVDTYLDTDDWRVYRAGYALRLRDEGGRAEAGLKALEGGAAAYRVRREFGEQLSERNPAALLTGDGPVRTRLRAVIGPRRLRPLGTLRTRRRSFAIDEAGKPAGVVVLDETTFPLAPEIAPRCLRRVEVEVQGWAVERLEPFVAELRQACGLTPASASKFETLLAAHAHRPPGSLELGPATFDASASIGEVAFATLRRHVAAFLAHEPGTRLGEDPEELHDMRVAARRLRAALRLFAGVLPPSLIDAREGLGWVAQALGAVRDLDVQLEQLDAWIAESDSADREALQRLAELLHERRERTRGRMLATLDSSRYERFVADVTAVLRRGPQGEHAAMPALTVAPGFVVRRERAFRRRGDRIVPESPPADYHALRIDGKKLRYALEFVSPLYGQTARSPIERLVALQDLLGAHQDACVAVDELRALAVAEADRLGPAAVFAVGRVAERYAARAVEARAAFPERYRWVVDAWNPFARQMEQERKRASRPRKG